MAGWIKLHRELTDKIIWQESTPEQKTILITLLMMANHQEKEWEWKGERYKAESGQFVTSLPSIVKKCGKGITIQNVRTALARFEKYEFLTDESTNKNRLITIVNWGLYQSNDSDDNRQPNRQLTGNQQATNRQLTANKNDKNVKNVKNVKNINKDLDDNISPKYSLDSFERKTVDYLINKILDEMPNARVPTTDKQKDSWCDHVERMIRLDKRTEVDIKKVLDFAVSDSFWKVNIRSTKKLREKYETLFLQMKNKRTNTSAGNNNKFNQFPQREYSKTDYAELEKKLLQRGL